MNQIRRVANDRDDLLNRVKDWLANGMSVILFSSSVPEQLAHVSGDLTVLSYSVPTVVGMKAEGIAVDDIMAMPRDRIDYACLFGMAKELVAI